MIDEFLALARVVPNVVSEIELVSSLGAAVMDGLGSTIIPASVAAGASSFAGADIRRLARPVIEATVSLCTSDHLPLSEPAVAVRSVLLDVVEKLMRKHPQGIPDGAISKVYGGRPHLCWLVPAASPNFNRYTGFR